jgi:hypothetical protein
MRDLKIRRMSEEDRSIEAKKEQARLSKHVVCRSINKKHDNNSWFLFSVYLIHRL